MLNKKIKTFSLKKVDFCDKPDVDVTMYIHNETLLFSETHTHDFYELNIVEEGSTGHIVNGEKYVLQKNEACLLSPGIIHTPFRSTDRFSIFSIGINVKFMEKIASTLDLKIGENIFLNPLINIQLTQTEINDIIHTLSYLGRTNIIMNPQNFGTPHFNAIIKIIVTKIVLKIFNLEQDAHVNIQNPYVNRVIQELNNSENFKSSIEDICAKLSFSHGYVTHLFKKAELDPPSKILLRNKLTHASMLLQNSTIKIIDIMESIGIYSSSYFNRVFKNEFGVSPSDFRKGSSIYKNAKNYYNE